MLNDVTMAVVITGAVLLIWHCPIFKPYFGFRRPNAPR
jgi:hypothetical protein